MTQIVAGIHQLQIPIPNNPLGYTNVYLLGGDDGHTLIDAGVSTEPALQALKKQLTEIGIGLEEISRIIVTHGHHDHYGLATRLRQLSQAKIMLHHLDRDLISSRELNMEEFVRQTEEWLRSNGVPADGLPPPWRAFAGMKNPASMLPDITLNGGETISGGVFNLQVLWTPGHSPGHVCLYEPTQKILFSGDHVLPVITPNISLQPQSGHNPLGDFLNSLNTVKRLDVNLTLPAHEHTITDLQTRVDEIIQHHEHRNWEILETMKAGAKNAYQISGGITWMPTLGGVSLENLAPWDRRMAVSETLAHLEAMRVDGRVDRFPRDGVIYYQPS